MERDWAVGRASCTLAAGITFATAATVTWVSTFSADDVSASALPYVVHDQTVSNFSVPSGFLSPRDTCDEQLGYAWLQGLYRKKRAVCTGARPTGSTNRTGNSEIFLFRESAAPGCEQHASEVALIENARLPLSVPGVSLIVDCTVVHGESLADAFSSLRLRGNVSVEQQQERGSTSAHDECADWIMEDTMFIDFPRDDYFNKYYHTMEEIFAVVQTAALLGRQVADFRYVFGMRVQGALKAMQLDGQLKIAPTGGYRPYHYVPQLIDLWSALVWRPTNQRMDALRLNDFRNRSICFRRLVFPMRACSGSILPATWSSRSPCSHGNPIALQVSKMIKQSFWQRYGSEFSRGSTDQAPDVAMIVRTNNRVLMNMNDVIFAVKALPGKPVVKDVDLGTLSIKEQVHLISGLRVLVGAHGSGLTSVLLLPRGAALVEITAYWWSRPRAPANIFMNMAAWTGHPYRWVLSWTWNIKEDLWWYTNANAVARAVQAEL